MYAGLARGPLIRGAELTGAELGSCAAAEPNTRRKTTQTAVFPQPFIDGIFIMILLQQTR
jgi:hypothetical protein